MASWFPEGQIFLGRATVAESPRVIPAASAALVPLSLGGELGEDTQKTDARARRPQAPLGTHRRAAAGVSPAFADYNNRPTGALPRPTRDCPCWCHSGHCTTSTSAIHCRCACRPARGLASQARVGSRRHAQCCTAPTFTASSTASSQVVPASPRPFSHLPRSCASRRG